MLASRPIRQARVLLNDPLSVRWTDAELLDWLNGGQLQIVAVRPDAKATKINMVLVAGTEQSIPAGGTKLLDVVRNIGGSAITLVKRAQLTDYDRSWYAKTASASITHYTFDDSDPKCFEVYPPAIAGTSVRVLYAALPTDCAATTSAIDLDDIYEGPLIDWVCYRAWSKDGDSAPDAQRAANAMATFMQALVGKSQADQASEPARK